MIRRSVFTLILSAVVAASSFAQAEDPALRKEVQALYTRWCQLAAKKDVKALVAMLDPSFQQVDAEGRITTYTQMKSQMESIMAICKDISCKITVDNVYRDGAEITAWGSMTISFKMKQGDKWVPQSFTEKFAETMKRVGGELKFIRSQSLPH